MKFLFLLFLVSPCFAEGPLFRHKSPPIQQEFENVYQDLRNLPSIIVSSSTVLDFPNTASSCSDIPVTVSGALDANVCSIGAPSGSVAASTFFTCYVSATNTVTTRFCTNGVTVNPASGSYTISLIRS